MVEIQTQNVRGVWWGYKHRMLGVYGGHTNTEC